LVASFWTVQDAAGFKLLFHGMHLMHLMHIRRTRGVSHTVALPFTLKSTLRHKKNYGNSNILACKNIIFKNPLKETKILQDIITLLLISSFNTSQNIIFQISSCKNRPIIT
jgi:hypothetical protein